MSEKTSGRMITAKACFL